MMSAGRTSGRLAASVLICVLVGLLMPVSVAMAESVRVLAAGAAQGAIRQLEPAFASATGHKLDAAFDTVGALRDRVLAGEKADVVILSEAGMAALEKAGKVAQAPPPISAASRWRWRCARARRCRT